MSYQNGKGREKNNTFYSSLSPWRFVIWGESLSELFWYLHHKIAVKINLNIKEMPAYHNTGYMKDKYCSFWHGYDKQCLYMSYLFTKFSIHQISTKCKVVPNTAFKY